MIDTEQVQCMTGVCSHTLHQLNAVILVTVFSIFIYCICKRIQSGNVDNI
jgi:hypothetical protein